MKTIEISDEALKIATKDQLDRVAVLLSSEKAERVTVTRGWIDLPRDYLSFRVDYTDGGQPMYGGIDVDGRAST